MAETHGNGGRDFTSGERGNKCLLERAGAGARLQVYRVERVLRKQCPEGWTAAQSFYCSRSTFDYCSRSTFDYCSRSTFDKMR